MTEVEALAHDIERHQRGLATAERAIQQMQGVLERIQDEAAMRKNGGAWAAGMATICLATLPGAQ